MPLIRPTNLVDLGTIRLQWRLPHRHLPSSMLQVDSNQEAILVSPALEEDP